MVGKGDGWLGSKRTFRMCVQQFERHLVRPGKQKLPPSLKTLIPIWGSRASGNRKAAEG